MKRTIFCVALILCMAIMAGCAAQASGKTQTPISAKTELTSAQEADDTAEVVTALLPSQTVEENSKTEDTHHGLSSGRRRQRMRITPQKSSLQPLKRPRPLPLNRWQYPRLHRRINLLPHPHRHLHRSRQRNRRKILRLRPNLRPHLSLPPAGTSTPSRRLSGRATSMRGRNPA